MKKQNPNSLKRVNKLFIIFVFAFLIINVPAPKNNMFANVQFKTHDTQSKSRLERNILNANEEADKAEWDRIVQSSKEALLAEWELDADKKIKDALLEESDRSVKSQQFEVEKNIAKAEWEKEADIQISIARGSWLASRQNISYSDFDKQLLVESLDAANDAADSKTDLKEKVASWDLVVNNMVSKIDSDFEKQLDLNFDAAFSLSDTILNENEKNAYLKSIEHVKQQFLIRYKHERNSIVYLGRNTLIAELFFDQESLRAKSEAESATTITENIISQTLDDLKVEEDKILARNTEADGKAGTIDFSQVGENWEEDIRKLVDKGLTKWGTAQDDLLGQMMLWKNDSENSFKEGNKKWEDAFRLLKEAQETWLDNISDEIKDALDEWEAQQNEFNTNLVKAKQDFANYVDVTKEEWNDHSAGLKNMAISGADAYKEAVDNINWLNDMSFEFRKKAEIRNTETFSITNKKTVTKNHRAENSVFDSYNGDIYLNTDANQTIEKYIQGFSDEAYNRLFQTWSDSIPVYKTVTYTDYSISGGAPQQKTKQEVDYYKSGWVTKSKATLTSVSITPTLSQTYYDADNKRLIEVYSINFNASGKYSTGVIPLYSGQNPNTPRTHIYKELSYAKTGMTFVREAKINVTDKYQAKGNLASYIFYEQEKERWTNIKTNFNKIIGDTELQMHSKNMQGENNGTGFLTNSDGNMEMKYQGNELEKDPYLMTTAELNYELARKNRDYYQKRLDIAQAVYNYAYPAGDSQKRESKDVTEKRLADAKYALYGDDIDNDGIGDGGAKGVYDNALLQVDNIVKVMKNIQDGTVISDTAAGKYTNDTSLAGLTKALDKAKADLETARADYQVFNKALILLANGDNESMREMIKKELEDLEKGLVKSRSEFNKEQETYYTKLLEVNKVDRLSKYATVLESVIKNRELSKVTFNNLKQTVFGQETEANLEKWFADLTTKKNTIWTTETINNYDQLAFYYNKWQDVKSNALASEKAKTGALETFKQALNNEYFRKENEIQLYSEQLNLLLDKEFSVNDYFSKESTEKRSVNNYKDFAKRNKEVIDYIKTSMYSINVAEFSYDKLKELLKNNVDSIKFQYGFNDANYDKFVVANAAYEYVVANFSDVTLEESNYIKQYIQEESQTADLIYDEIYLNDNIKDNLETYISQANSGNQQKKALLREYYLPGAMLSTASFINKYDSKIVSNLNKNSLIEAFIDENADKFVSNELAESISWQKSMNDKPAAGTFYDILDYSNNWEYDNEDRQAIENYGENVNFLTMDIKVLKSFARNAEGYLKDGLLEGKVISRSVRELIDQVANLKNQVEIYEYIKTNYSTVTEADVEGAKTELENVNAALLFTDDFQTIFASTDITTSGKVKDLIKKYDELSADVKKYVNNELVATIDTLKTKESERNLYEISTKFMSSEHDLDMFVQVEGANLTEQEKASLTEYLKPLSIKKAYHKTEVIEPALLDYLTTLTLDADQEAEMQEYILIDYFMNMHSNGIAAYSDVKDEFKDYSKYYHFENFVENNRNSFDALTTAIEKEDFITSLIDNFCTLAETSPYADASIKDSYNEFATKFYNDEASSATYLPEILQSYVAAGEYFDAYYYDGKVIDSQANLDNYYNTNYQNKGFNDSVRNELYKYTKDLNLIDDYYGNSLNEYLEGKDLTADEEKIINRYYYLSKYYDIDDSLMPGLYVGNGQLANQINDDLKIATAISDEIYNELEEKLTDIFISVDDQKENIMLDINKKQTALDFKNDPDNFKNFRNHLLAIEKDDDTDFAGLSVLSESTYSYDVANAEGNITTFNSGAGNALGNIDSYIFETAGKLAESLNLLKKVSSIDQLEYEANENFSVDQGLEVYSINSFIDALNKEYNKDLDLTTDVVNTKVDFNDKMRQLFDNVSSSKADVELELSTAEKAMKNHRYTYDDLSAKIIEQKESYDVIGTSDFEQVEKDTTAAGLVVEAKEAIYNAALLELEARQAEYQTQHDTYITAMDNISATYTDFKVKESEYEEAYAIWEYANTPYLKDTLEHDTEITEGETTTGENVSMEDYKIPDANERLITAKENYKTALETFNEAETVKNGDSSKLLNDTVYKSLSQQYINKTDSYVRTDRAKTILTQELGMLESLQEEASINYENAKDALEIFRVAEEGKTPKTGQISKDERDQLVFRIIGNGKNASGKIRQFVDGLYYRYCVDMYAAYKNSGGRWGNHYKTDAKWGYDKYYALSSQQRADINRVYNIHKASQARADDTTDSNDKYNVGQNLYKMAQERYNYIHAQHRYRFYNDKYHDAPRRKYKRRRRAKKNRNKWETARNQAYNVYIGQDGKSGIDPTVIRQFNKACEAKRVLGRMSDKTKNVGYVRYLTNAERTRNVDDRKINTRTLNDIFKSGTDKYALRSNELENLYDNELLAHYTAQGQTFNIDDDSINLATARKLIAREDLDGKHLNAKVKIVNGVKRVIVLDTDSKVTNESYLLSDTTIVLKDNDGNTITADNMVNGKNYKLYDNIYKVTDVMNIIASGYSDQREIAKNDFNTYAESSITSYNIDNKNGHDKVHILRDQESMYWTMLQNTVKLDSSWYEIDSKCEVKDGKIYLLTKDGDRTGKFYNQKDIDGSNFYFTDASKTYVRKRVKEDRIRGYNGYKEILDELVYNEQLSGEKAVGTQIVDEMLSQNAAFQNQLWAQQQKTFDEKKQTWNQTVGFILNRGKRDWQNQMNSFTAKWMKWRIDTRKMIEQGEDDWVDSVKSFQNDMANWQKDVSEASSEEAVEQLYNSIDQRLSAYTKGFNGQLGGNVSNLLNIDSLKDEILNNQPAMLGVLNNSMQHVNTTVGFSQMLQLNLDNSMTSKYDTAMNEFEESMEIIQNLKMSEIIFKTIEGFNEQLNSANEGAYEGIGQGVYRSVLSTSIYKRDKATNKWVIRYVKENNLIGGVKYGWIHVEDFRNYETDIVNIEPIKNGKGGEIDFTDATTFSMLDAGELEAVVNVQMDLLNKNIEKVFKQDGDKKSKFATVYSGGRTVYSDGSFSFSEHMAGESKRLFGDESSEGSLSKAYEKWMMGQMLLDQAGYNRPIFSGGPSSKQAAQIAATVAASATGQPWIAFAVNSAFIATDVAMGDVSWKHAGTQMAVGAATSVGGPIGTLAAIGAGGITYDEDGGIGWSKSQFKSNAKGEIIKGGITLALGNNPLGAGVSAGVMSGMDTSGGWTDFSFDKSGWKDHLATGVIAGASNAATTAFSAGAGDFSNTFTNKMIGGLVTSTLGKLYADASGNADFYNRGDLWNSMTANASDLGSFLGGEASSALIDKYAPIKKDKDGKPILDENGKPVRDTSNPMPDDPLGAAAHALGAVFYGNQKISEYTNGITKSIRSGNFGDAWNGVTDLGESLGNWDKGFRTNTQIAVDAGVNEYFKVNPDAEPGAGRKISVYDINDALNAGKKGGSHWNEDINKNMGDLITRMNDYLGLEGGERMKTGDELQDALDSGTVSEQDIILMGSLGMSDKQMNTFNNVYGTADGLNNGYIHRTETGYVNNAGQDMGGFWKNGYSMDKPVPVTQPEFDSGSLFMLGLQHNKDIYTSLDAPAKSYTSPVYDTLPPTWMNPLQNSLTPGWTNEKPENYDTIQGALFGAGLFGIFGEVDKLKAGSIMTRKGTSGFSKFMSFTHKGLMKNGRFYGGGAYYNSVFKISEKFAKVTNIIGKAGQGIGIAAAGLSSAYDVYNWANDKGIKGDRVAFNAMMNTYTVGLGFVPFAGPLLSVGMGYMNYKYGDEMYTQYMSARESAANAPTTFENFTPMTGGNTPYMSAPRMIGGDYSKSKRIGFNEKIEKLLKDLLDI